MKSRRKGARVENAIVRLLQDRGFAAEKVSGMYKPGADLSIPLLGRDFSVEVKARAAGFKQLYDWLADRDILIIKQDRREPLVVLPFRLAAEIAAHTSHTYHMGLSMTAIGYQGRLSKTAHIQKISLAEKCAYNATQRDNGTLERRGKIIARPHRGKRFTTHTNVSLTSQLNLDIRQFMKKMGLQQSEALRRLLTAGLKYV